MYLVSLEYLVGNGIISSQVIDLLCNIKKHNSNNVNMVLVAIQPVIIIGRNGITINRSVFEKDNDIRVLLNSHDIKLVLIPFILPQLKRWGVYFNIWLLSLFTIYSMPILYVLTIIHKTNLIHCRGYLSGILAAISSLFRKNVKFIFDPRGFLPEEGVEQKLWKYKSVTYNIWKYIEYNLLKKSDKVIALSREFANHLKDIYSNVNVSVVYAGVNVDKYNTYSGIKNDLKYNLDLNDKKVFIYVGSLGAWNSPEILAITFKEILKIWNNSYLIVLTSHDKLFIENIFSGNNVNKEYYLIRKCLPSDVPNYLSISDYGIIPGRMHTNDNFALSITNKTMIGLKVSEYLATGLPVIVNKDITALANIVSSNMLGYFFKYDGNMNCIIFDGKFSLPDDSYKEISYRCKKFAIDNLSLNNISKLYFNMYTDLVRFNI